MKYNVKFQLYQRSTVKGTQSVRMRVTWLGNRFDHFLPISIDSTFWDETRMKVKSTYRPNGDLSAANKANAIISDSKTLVDKYFSQCEVEEIEATLEGLKAWVHTAKGINKSAPQMRLFSEVVEEYIEMNSASRGWSKGMVVSVRHIQTLLNQYSPHAKLGEINGSFIYGFTEYLYRRNYRNTTVKKRFQSLKSILIWCASRGYPVPRQVLEYELKFKGTNSAFLEVIYLTWDEVMRLRNCSFNGERYLAKTRDVFLFCCFSGLRYSDVLALKKTDIVDDRIRVITKKTTKAVDIELNQFTREILAKYQDCNLKGKALPVITLHCYNHNLKKMAKEAGIDAPTKIVYYYKSERRVVVLPKYEIISSHCARRTFVVNALRLGIQPEVIMSWTGHANLDAMKPYVKIVDELKSSHMSKFDSAEQEPMNEGEESISTISPSEICRDSDWHQELSQMSELSSLQREDCLQAMSIVSASGKDGISFADMVESSGMSTTTLRRRLYFLREHDYLMTIGKGKEARWMLFE